jgi:hypothetical protein
MDLLNSFYEFFSGKEFSIPLWEVIAFVIFNTICLLFGRYRLGLVISYSFVFYWGFIFNMDNFVSMLDGTRWGMPIYTIAGISMFTMAVISFFVHGRE